MQAQLQPEERFDGIMARVEERKIPFWAHLDLTYRCNQQCLHCYCQDLAGDFSSNQEELTLGEVCRLLDQLADMGSLHLTLSGGEVFLRRDFFDIAAHAKKRHFALKIFTNGSLIDEETARRLAAIPPVQIEMSIYGVTAPVHDSITQRAGSFHKLVEAVALLKKYHLRVELKSVVMKQNFHHAGDLEAFSRTLGADDFRLSTDISPKNDRSRSPQQHQISEGQLCSLLSRSDTSAVVQHEYWSKPLERPLCQTGTVGCYICPYGDVYPCLLLFVPMGNIREKSLREIWYAPSALRDELNTLRTYADLHSCSRCQYVQFCNNCIGLAQLETGDARSCYSSLKTAARAAYEASCASRKEEWYAEKR